MGDSLGAFQDLIQRATEAELYEDKDVIEKGTQVSQGNVKEVYLGLREEMLQPMEMTEELNKIFLDLYNNPKVVNTWGYSDGDQSIVKQDFIDEDLYSAMQEQGLDHVIEETVEVFESIAEDGYIYRDLKPDNIRFLNGYAIAVDYLDEQAVEPIQEDMQIAAAKSYDLFIKELTDSIPNLGVEELEQKIDKYSKHVEADEYTGDPFIDFGF